MDESEQHSPGIPIPKASYSFNFDDIDDTFNPFQSKSSCGIQNSPPINAGNINPFQGKSKLGQSPPVGSNNNNNQDAEIDPFSAKNKLGSSPPQHAEPKKVGNKIPRVSPDGAADVPVVAEDAINEPASTQGEASSSVVDNKPVQVKKITKSPG